MGPPHGPTCCHHLLTSSHTISACYKTLTQQHSSPYLISTVAIAHFGFNLAGHAGAGRNFLPRAYAAAAPTSTQIRYCLPFSVYLHCAGCHNKHWWQWHASCSEHNTTTHKEKKVKETTAYLHACQKFLGRTDGSWTPFIS